MYCIFIDADMMRFRSGWRVAARDIFMLIIGVLIGLCVSQSMEITRCSNIAPPQFKHPRYDSDVIEKSLTQNISKLTTQVPKIRKNQHEIDKNLKRPKYLKDELHIRKPLYIGVVTASEFLNTRAMGVNGTWGHKASKVEYYAAEGQGSHPLPVVSLEGVDDTYPPQKKVYRMLKYMHDHYIDEFNWFFRADDDVYIRIPELLDLLSTLDPTEPLYIGSPGLGKPEDLERIKLYPHERYCMGGPGVVFSRELLIQLVPHLDDCLQNVVVSWNEDLEVGRCISRRLGVQCTWAYEVGYCN